MKVPIRKTRKEFPMSENKNFSLLGILELVTHTVFLNLLFLICSLPIVTMGASLTALYGGLRASIKKEPCYKAFFRTFRKSFLRSTLAWLVLLPVNVWFITNLIFNVFYWEQGSLVSLFVSAIFALVFLGFSTVLFLFYSRFEATTLQLFQYSAKIFFDYPIRSIVIGLLSWFPFVLPFFAVGFQIFLLLGMVWLFYFATIATLAIWLMNQPFALFAVNVLEMEDHRRNNNDH